MEGMKEVTTRVFLSEEDKTTLETMATQCGTSLGGMLTVFCCDLAQSIYSGDVEAQELATQWYNTCKRRV